MMRFPFGLLASVGAFVLSIGNVFAAPAPIALDKVERRRRRRAIAIPGRTGRAYPHSSIRQRARYARQIAARQLSMEGVIDG